jgi:hypothetical protein
MRTGTIRKKERKKDGEIKYTVVWTCVMNGPQQNSCGSLKSTDAE